MSKASAQAATPAEGSILALDAAGRSCSAALWDGNRIVAQRFALMERGQAEALIPMIGAVMADFPFERLERIAVSRGPGGFTGVRIGLAAARGLALAVNRPLVGLSSFAALAAGLAPEAAGFSGLLVCLEAKRREFYLQAYAAGPEPDPSADPLPCAAPGVVASGAARLISPDALAAELVARAASGTWLLAGDAAPQAASALAQAGIGHQLASRAQHVEAAEIARLLGRGLVQPEPPEPLYLRGADVTLPGTAGGRIRRSVTT